MEILNTFIADKQLMDDCRSHAIEVTKINYKYYSETRNQSNFDKIVDDAYYGKLTEWAAYDYLNKLGLLINKPSMVVLQQKDKSYESDLISSGYPIHIKGCPNHRLPNPTWAFQNRDLSLVYNPSPLDIIGLGVYYEHTDPVKIEIIKFFRAMFAKNYFDKLYKESLNQSKDEKKALYWVGNFYSKNIGVQRLEDFDFNILLQQQ